MGCETGEVTSFVKEFFQMQTFVAPKIPKAVLSSIYEEVRCDDGPNTNPGLTLDQSRLFLKRVHDFVYRNLWGEVKSLQRRKATTSLVASMSPCSLDKDSKAAIS